MGKGMRTLMYIEGIHRGTHRNISLQLLEVAAAAVHIKCGLVVRQHREKELGIIACGGDAWCTCVSYQRNAVTS